MQGHDENSLCVELCTFGKVLCQVSSRQTIVEIVGFMCYTVVELKS